MQIINSTTKRRHTTHCPICALQCRKASSFVREGIDKAVSPYDILLGLKERDYVPLNKEGTAISTPNRWRDVLSYHVNVCMQKDFDTYEKSWKQHKTDCRLTQEFNAQAVRLGLMDVIQQQPIGSLTVTQRQAYIEALESGDIAKILALPVESVVDKGDLIKACQHLVPTIIVNQLAIITRVQTDYIEGRSSSPPTREFGTVLKCLEIMSTVLGDFGVEDVIKITGDETY